MTATEITRRVNALGSAWEQFKSVNERRIEEIERKGAADPLTLDHLGRIDTAMHNYKSRLDRMETALSRPGFSGYETKELTDPAMREYKEAFCNYLRKGVEGDLPNLEKKALSIASDPDGGYLVSPQLSDKIIHKVFETSPMRMLASVDVISSDAMELIEDTDEAFAGWTTETNPISTDTNTPKVGKKMIPVHELYAQPKATQKLIDDAAVDIESWLAEKIADVFARKENAAFINGDGIGKPRGILTYAAGTAWGQIEQINSAGGSNFINGDSLLNAYYALKEDYAQKATFLMNRASVQKVRLIKEALTGQYIWSPGLAAGAPDTLLGVPVVQAADMPDPTTNNLSIAVGDFARAYQIVDRTGIRILRDPFTNKPFVNFYTTKRVGGDVVNFEAIKLLKMTTA